MDAASHAMIPPLMSVDRTFQRGVLVRGMDAALLATIACLAEAPRMTPFALTTLCSSPSTGTLELIRRMNDKIAFLRTDRRGGSTPGRRKRIDRLPCQWMQQYLCPYPIYGPRHFQDAFGVPRTIFDKILEVLGPKMKTNPAADGRVGFSPEVQLLATLRILRTGSSLAQFDDQTGMARSTLNKKFR